MAHTLVESLTRRLSLESNPGRFLRDPENAGERLRFFSQKGFELTLGTNAASFLKHAALYHQQGLFSPPYTEEKVSIIRHQFSTWDKDLTGNEWKNTWQDLKTQYHLSDEQVKNLQLEILTAYRFKVISQIAVFPQSNLTVQKVNETKRTHDYLQTLNKSLRDLSQYRTRSASELYSHTQSTLKKNLDPFLSELIKAIKNKDFNEFGIAFENMKKSANKLGSQATVYVIESLKNQNGQEFFIALPRLIEASPSFQQMFLSHPEARALLGQSIELVKNSNFRHKHGLIDKITGRKHAETLRGHILLLERLLENLPLAVPPVNTRHWMVPRSSHEILQREPSPETTKPIIGRRNRS